MLTMFQLCQVMVMISFSSSITLLASDQLHPAEVEALTQIGKTVKEDGQPSLKFVGRCQSGRVVETEPTSAGNSTIECNCSITDDNYCHITSFQLEDYDLPGRLPPELANLTYVQNMSVESNQFSGVVPPELGKLVNLKTLILSGNKLVGTLPEALAQIKDLKDFRASDNNLNGTVPEFIGNWTQLQKLSLEANQFSGTIPSQLGDLVNLTDLFLSGNKLNGSVPDSFFKTDKKIDVSYNNFSLPPSCQDHQ
ncbi:hypothetical protein D5086_021608 [Populus alba]|uniref:Uncharacterized protein n=1 Tax=Populus alba TaxID=43335 RepID=A0ACC4BD81_POPAL